MAMQTASADAGNHMRTILFFDDWMIQNSRNLERKWLRAEPWPGHQPSFDRSLQYSYVVPTIHFDADEKLWQMWAGGVQKLSDECGAGDGIHGVFLYESKDGLDWRPRVFDPPVDKRASRDLSHLVFSSCAYEGPPFVFHLLESEVFPVVADVSLKSVEGALFNLLGQRLYPIPVGLGEQMLTH